MSGQNMHSNPSTTPPSPSAHPFVPTTTIPYSRHTPHRHVSQRRTRPQVHTDTVTMHLARPIFASSAVQPPKSIRSGRVHRQQRQPAPSHHHLKTRCRDPHTSGRSTQLLKRSIHVLEPESGVEKIVSDLRMWASRCHRSIQPERKQFIDYFIDWLQRSSKDKTTEMQFIPLRWNLTNYFDEKYIQSTLQNLTITLTENAHMPSSYILKSVFKNLKNLKILKIEGEKIESIPDSITNLLELIHLSIINTNITELPDAIGYMYNLNSFNIVNNKELTRLPTSFVALVHLEYLSIEECNKIRILPDFNPDRPLDESFKFSNLRSLKQLKIKNCSELLRIPESICKLQHLEQLILTGCRKLEELPEKMNELSSLKRLRFFHTHIQTLPIGLYQLALRNKLPLAEPWHATIIWMLWALQKNPSPYTIELNHLKIKTKPETMILFAQEHLKLLVNALETAEGGLSTPPLHVSITYEGEAAIDLGGLRRDFFYHLFPNCARQVKHDLHPILVNKGNFLLFEMDINQLAMTASQQEFCENSGKLIAAAFARSDSCTYQLGNIFPEHFYAGLLYAAFYLPSISFVDLPQKTQIPLCRILAIHDKEGITDTQNHLLFDMHCLKESGNSLITSNQPIHPDDLYKIWKLMNHYEGNEENDEVLLQELMKKGFHPSIARFLIPGSERMTREDFSTPSEEFPDGILEAFQEELGTAQNRRLIQTTLSRYMLERYSQQCKPLIYVAKGFKSLSNEDFPGDFQREVEYKLERAAGNMGVRRPPHHVIFSYLVQGPPLTYESFAALMRTRCTVRFAIPGLPIPPECPSLNEKVTAIKEWYLTEASDDQRKELLRCINGTDVIQVDTEIKFSGPRQLERHWNGNSYFEPSELSVFHTCSGAVELGNALIRIDLSQAEGKAALISTWLDHITLALPKEGSMGGFGVI